MNPNEVPGTRRPLVARMLGGVILAVDRLPLGIKYALAWIGVVAGVAAISAVFMTIEPWAASVDCDGEPMSPGDVCKEYREPEHDLVDTKSYDETWQDQHDANIMVGRIGLAIAAVLLVIGIAHVIQTIRASRAMAS
jgi:hypothetical protein